MFGGEGSAVNKMLIGFLYTWRRRGPVDPFAYCSVREREKGGRSIFLLFIDLTNTREDKIVMAWDRK